MTHSKWLMAVVMWCGAEIANAQDPIPVAYWSHSHRHSWGQPGVNAFTPPMPYYYAPGPQFTTAPRGYPEAGVQSPFIIPACAPYCQRQCCLQGLFNRGGGFGGGGGPPTIDSLPTHPYVRSPRDFFMFYENLEAERSRDLRPTLIP